MTASFAPSRAKASLNFSKAFLQHGPVAISSASLGDSVEIAQAPSGVWASSSGSAEPDATPCDKIALVLTFDVIQLGEPTCLFDLKASVILNIVRPECDEELAHNPHEVVLRFRNAAGETVHVTWGEFLVGGGREHVKINLLGVLGVNTRLSKKFRPASELVEP